MTATLHIGDMRTVLRGMDACSVDAVVCDPPYGLKFMGKGWDHGVPGPEFWVEALRVMKPGAHIVAFGATKLFHRLVSGVEDAGFVIVDTLCWLYGQGMPKTGDISKRMEKAGLDGSAWVDWSDSLKPAFEPIILARKPIKGSAIANVAAHGTGALNIGACRIDASGGRPARVSERRDDLGTEYDSNVYAGRVNTNSLQPGSRAVGETTLGRFPANVLLDEEAAAVLDEQTGTLKSGAPAGGVGNPHRPTTSIGVTGDVYEGSAEGSADGSLRKDVETHLYADSGGASRFFYTSKSSKRERNAGLPEGVTSDHPTVKPVDLMCYLVRLVTPPNGVVLDPFMGSGTTGVAATMEGFDFIGCDLDAHYVNDLAKLRIAHAGGEVTVAESHDDAPVTPPVEPEPTPLVEPELATEIAPEPVVEPEPPRLSLLDRLIAEREAMATPLTNGVESS